MPTILDMDANRISRPTLLPLLLCMARVASSLLVVGAVASAQITLDDPDFQARLSAAREYKLPKIVYQQNTWLDGFKEIGPPGQRNTLASMEFPWRHPGGLDYDGTTRKFVYPPDLKPYRLVQVTTVGYGNNQGEFRRTHNRPGWVWPEGATFFELHYHRVAGHPYELRILHKVDAGFGFDSYEAHIFRPFNAESELPFVVKGVREAVKVCSTHPLNPFESESERWVYPDVTTDWAALVKSKPWSDGHGHDWHHAGRGDKWLTPKNYLGCIIGSDEEGCRKCHSHAGDHVDAFEPGRDWYGHLPGMNSIFSYDPIDRRTVSRSGPIGGGFRWRNN